MAATLDGVEEPLAAAVLRLIQASHGRINIQSGFRTEAQQAKLYAEEPNLAAPPGHSNHERGLAVDLGGDYALIAQLAPQFGLVTPMSWEPWHVELPGTRKTAQPTAYTLSPYGHPNPTVDPQIDASPQTQLANLSGAMQALSMPSLGEATTPPLADTAIPPTEQGSTSPAVHYPQGEAPGGRSGNPKGSVDPGQLYKMLRAQGVDPVHAAALVAIAGRESGYNPSAHNGNAGTGDNSYGLFQINLLGGMHSQYSPEMLSTAEGSAQAAAQMVKSGGLQPWGPYKNMSWSYGTNLAAAAAASGGEVTLQQLEGIVNEGLH